MKKIFQNLLIIFVLNLVYVITNPNLTLAKFVGDAIDNDDRYAYECQEYKISKDLTKFYINIYVDDQDPVGDLVLDAQDRTKKPLIRLDKNKYKTDPTFKKGNTNGYCSVYNIYATEEENIAAGYSLTRVDMNNQKYTIYRLDHLELMNDAEITFADLYPTATTIEFLLRLERHKSLVIKYEENVGNDFDMKYEHFYGKEYDSEIGRKFTSLKAMQERAGEQ